MNINLLKFAKSFLILFLYLSCVYTSAENLYLYLLWKIQKI